MKVRKDDRVMVMAGKDLGVTGRILKVDPGRNKVLVEGVNRIKRHEKIRPTQRGGQTGGITEKGSNSRIEIVRIENGQRKSIDAKQTDVLKPGDQVNVRTRRL